MPRFPTTLPVVRRSRPSARHARCVHLPGFEIRGVGLLLAMAVPAAAQDGAFPDIGRAPSRMAERVPIFFPPSPPPLGRALPRGATPTGRLAAPPELAAHVNEPYYPQLGTRLATNTLPPKLRTQLDEYLGRKRALQAELRAELERVRPFDPAEREVALAAFARRQAAPLAALEATAEQLRRDLTAGEQTWGALREWHLGDRERRGFSPVEIAQVMRAYAYYQNGLLPGQRRLLREISLELLAAGDNPDKAAANQPFLFFPPEPARVLLPDDIPAAVAAKLAVFQTRKSALKKQLYDAVSAHDGRRFAFLRTNPLKSLAESQAPVFSELEAIAEEIRRGLAVMPDAAPVVERTPLPPVLQHRVAALLRDAGAAQQETVAAVEAILAGARDLPLQATYRFEADGLKFLVVPSRAGRGGGPPPGSEVVGQIAAVRDRIGAVAADYGRRLTALLSERDALRSEISRTLNLAQDAAIDRAFNTAVRVATARETVDAYREYRTAMFQPGLSPEQRRLLFDSVIERLELPLPRGELQPVARSATW